MTVHATVDEFESVRSYARVAGILLIISLVAGSIGEFIVPSRLIVSGDAAATVRNISENESLFRLSFAAYLTEAVCDISLSLVFYVLLRPISRNIALLSALFGLVSTAVFAGGELFYFAPPLILSRAEYVTAFTAPQRDALVLFALKLYAMCGGIFLGFYGIATAIRGYLIFRSTYLPAVLGILLMAGGLGFILQNLTLVLAPAYSSNLFLAPMSIAGLSLIVWLLVKGIDRTKFEAVTGGAAELL